MGKGLIFFCCSCCILILTIVNLSIGPVISGKVSQTYDPITQQSYEWATANCKRISDYIDDSGASDDDLKYNWKWLKDECTREKGMHDMEYTAFIFDIVIGFICSLIGLLHIFEVKKDFVSNTGLIGLICGIVGFVLTFVYVIFNGIVYTTYGIGGYKLDGDSAFAKKVKSGEYECLYFDKKENLHSLYATYSDLIKKQYNYEKDKFKDVDDGCKLSYNTPSLCIDSSSGEAKEKFSLTVRRTDDPNKECDNLYYEYPNYQKIEYKDISDRFLTALILSLFVCLANIGLAIFGFLLFRTPGDF